MPDTPRDAPVNAPDLQAPSSSAGGTQAVRYPSIGRCIYCDDSTNPESLTTEHIIPDGMGGRLLFLGASCSECANVTKKFEQEVLRETLLSYRLHMKVKGRNKGTKRRASPVGLPIRENEHSDWKIVSPEDHPIAGGMPIFDAPSILSGAPLDTPIFIFEMEFFITPAAQKQLDKYGKSHQTYNTFSIDSFCLFLAKVAHSYAMANRIPFSPALREIILKKSFNYGAYIGSLPYITWSQSGELHWIKHSIISGYVFVHIRFFAKWSNCTYSIAVGPALA